MKISNINTECNAEGFYGTSAFEVPTVNIELGGYYLELPSHLGFKFEMESDECGTRTIYFRDSSTRRIIAALKFLPVEHAERVYADWVELQEEKLKAMKF